MSNEKDFCPYCYKYCAHHFCEVIKTFVNTKKVVDELDRQEGKY